MANLTWSLKKKYDNCGGDGSWISLDITSGDEDTKPKITVTKATKPTDCASGFVILSLSNGEEEIIEVSRCVPECTCEEIDFNSNIPNPISKDGGTITLGTYTIKDECKKFVNVATDGVVLCNATIGSDGTLTATANKNTYTEERNGYFKLLFKGETCGEIIDVKQAGESPDACSNSSSDNATVSPITMNFETDGGSSSFTISNNSCWPVISITSDSSWITISDTDNVKKVTVPKNESNISTRTGHATVTFYNAARGKFCYRTITITQEFTSKCDCATLLPTFTHFERIPAEGYEDEKHTIADLTFFGDKSSCVLEDLGVKIEMEESVDWVYDTEIVEKSNGYIFKGKVGKNETVNKTRSFILNTFINDVEHNNYVKCNNSGSRIEIKQDGAEKVDCKCSDMEIEYDDNITVPGNGGNDIVIAQYTDNGSCSPSSVLCAINITGSDVWVTKPYVDYSSSPRVIRANVKPNDEDEDRTFDIMLIIDNVPCSSYHTVTQKKNSDPGTKYEVDISLFITNNNNSGIYYDGNRYGFGLIGIKFISEIEGGDYEINLSNMLLKGTTEEKLSIYLNENETLEFKEIQLYGSNAPGESGYYRTYCTNCGDKKIDEEHDGAEFYITLGDKISS